MINFDYPNTSEDYIHRIGRTARASRKGTAYTFITPNDSRNIDDLVEVLKEANQEIPHALMMMRECFGGTKPGVFLDLQCLCFLSESLYPHSKKLNYFISRSHI